MGQLVFQATLGGQVNLVGPNTASTFNLNVPAVSSTIATLTGTETFTNKTLTTPVISSLSSAAATALTLQSAGTTAITVDTSQRVIAGYTASVGTAYQTMMQVKGQGSASTYAGYGLITSNNESAGLFGVYSNGENSLWIASDPDNLRAGSKIVFSTDGSDKATIDASGNLLVGRTSGVASEKFSVLQSASDWCGQFVNSYSGTYYGIRANSSSTQNNTSSLLYDGLDGGNLRFRVYSNGGIANYAANNSILSDQREKTNFAPATSYLDKICAIPVQTFNYIDQNLEEDGGLTLGVVAQDVQAVAPELVTEGNWGSKEEPKMRLEIYQTDLQYALMKSIQELKALNDTQAETINALTARIVALEAK